MTARRDTIQRKVAQYIWIARSRVWRQMTAELITNPSRRLGRIGHFSPNKAYFLNPLPF